MNVETVADYQDRYKLSTFKTGWCQMVSDGVRMVSNGLKKVSDGVWKVLDGVRKVSDGVINVSYVVRDLSGWFQMECVI